MKSVLEGRDVPRTGQRRICPAVLILLDDDVAGLGADLPLELARWHPDALAFATAVRMTGGEGEDRRRRLLRVAIESVTDVVARREVLQRGYFVEDTIRVFLVFSAGGLFAEGALSKVVQTVHRVGAEFFDQTQLEVHALVFLPDLTDPWERELRYRDAYLKLLEVDEAGSTDRALAHRPHSSFDHRWFVDSRTRAGGHAGRLADLRSPVAEFLAVLLDGREGGPAVAARQAREQLRARSRERHSAYSTFGLAVLFHYPNMLLRALSCYAGERYLSGYLGRVAAVHTHAPDALDVLPPGFTAEGDFAQTLRDWSAEIQKQLTEAIHPDLRASTQLGAEERTRQSSHRTTLMDGLGGWMERAAREVLVAGGIPLARRLVDALGRTGATDDPLHAAAAAVAELRAAALRHVREFLRLDQVIARENELRARQQQLDAASAAADPAARDEADRALQEQVAARRRLEALLDMGADPDTLEESLLAEEPGLERIASTAPAASAASAASANPPTSSAPAAQARSAPANAADADAASAQAPAQKRSRLSRMWQRIRSWFKKKPAVASGPVAPVVRSSSSPGGRDPGPKKETQVDSRPIQAPQPMPVHTVPAPRAAWQAAERLRVVNTYALLVARLDRALREHEADVASAAWYYHHGRRGLQRWLTHGSRFYVPALRPDDFRHQAGQYVDRIQARLAHTWDRRQLARCFRVVPTTLSAFDSRPLVRLPGLEDALVAAGQAVGAPLLDGSLASLLRERSQEGGDVLLDLLRGLADSSEPLARPRPPGEQQLYTARWMFGHADLLSLFRGDPQSARMLDEREVTHVNDGDRHNLMLCSSLHGFPAHSLRKMLAFRARAHDREGRLPAEAEDLVPLDVGREWEGSSVFELAVLAKVLGILQPAVDPEDGTELLVFEELEFPRDLLSVTDELAFSIRSRDGEARLERAIDGAFAQPSAIHTLRAASQDPALSRVERTIVLDTIAEYQSRSSIAWNVPIIGEEATT